ncbi:TonB-dependent receptor plug domain-containing protein [Plebeiibacterium marinum]|uniref:TonB-dependent receptor n=1 Tax=Plebeiibacterium marinum TaxID=2992111 RepID=A0AAE3MGL3_9BACT|nr:TonB-dependent receptor plug domain-containing protein [Plebeiobacterium marinum]MCW3807618.1 TonB-dependent receptor [Plebeiobacterium marinum]
MTKKILHLFILLIFAATINAQNIKKDISTLTRSDVLEMSIEDLANYDLEEVMKIMDIVGASSIEELYELLLNKDVTSASKSEESLFDSPLSTTVLSSNEIITSGATSIEEALRMVPGVIVREKTNGVYDVQIRGGQNMPMNNMLIYAENTTTLVMVDGRPVFNYGMGGILWETLPISLGELDRIEVVRGPSSALYGPNAVNGVINLISKNINEDTPVISTNIQGGSLSTFIGDVNVKKQINDKLAMGISGSFETRNRESEEIYAIYADEFLSISEFVDQNDNNPFGKWSNDSYYEMIDEADIAKEKKGVNAYIAYKEKDNLTFNVSTGYLESQAMTSTLGDNPSLHNIRSSEGYHINFVSNLFGFNLQASLNNVEQDFCRGRSGWQQSTEQYNVNLDYLLKWNKLSFRPGISYQSVYYDDRDNIEKLGDGFFNARVALRNFAASGRFDFTPIEKLRLVAALRAEKYNVPDKWMPSYQFIGSYKINENNLFRAVYSRANQSTFMINAYSNYTWNRDGLKGPSYVHFGDNNDPNMMVMNMIELGFRTRPSKRILLDIEAFYNRAKDFSALMPDELSYEVTDIDFSEPTSPSPIGEQTLHTSHRSLDVESKQFGISISADMVISKKLQLKAHVNWQQTKLDNFTDAGRDNIATLQGGELTSIVTANLANDAPTILSGKPKTYSSDLQPGENPLLEQYLASNGILKQIEVLNDVDNEAMPSFWGSLSLTYKPIEKLSITAQGYYYDNYYMYSQYENDPRRAALIAYNIKPELEYSGNMDSKFLLNAKINYKINDNIDVFVNGRNILDNDSQEYVFMDKIGGLYLAGINLRF